MTRDHPSVYLRARALARMGRRQTLVWSAHARTSIRTRGLRLARGGFAPTRWSITRGSYAQAWFRRTPNFGDAISPLITGALTGLRPIWVPPEFAPKVVSTGSIMSYARSGDLVLGAGLIRDECLVLPRDAIVLAVRGPLTHERLDLRNVGENSLAEVHYGDPGLLIPDVFAVVEPSREDQPRIAIVPHYADRAAVKEAWPVLRQVGRGCELVLLDAAMPPTDFIGLLSQCTSCVSSSLHGVIAAEALGLGAVWVVVGDRITGGSFKFRDYYLGTGRTPPVATGLVEGVEAAASGFCSATLPDTTGIRSAFRMAASLLNDGET